MTNFDSNKLITEVLSGTILRAVPKNHVFLKDQDLKEQVTELLSSADFQMNFQNAEITNELRIRYPDVTSLVDSELLKDTNNHSKSLSELVILSAQLITKKIIVDNVDDYIDHTFHWEESLKNNSFPLISEEAAQGNDIFSRSFRVIFGRELKEAIAWGLVGTKMD